MKKLITILLLVISNVSFGQFSFVGANHTTAINNDTLIIYLTTYYYNSSCTAPINYSFTVNNPIVNLNVEYFVPTVSQALDCSTTDTFKVQLPSGEYDLTVCIDLIGYVSQTQIDTVLGVDCDTSSNIVLGTEELSFLENSISIFPNPVSSTFSILSKNNISIESAKLFDLQGRELQFITTNFEQIDTSRLPAGNYFMEIITDQGILRKKLMKE